MSSSRAMGPIPQALPEARSLISAAPAPSCKTTCRREDERKLTPPLGKAHLQRQVAWGLPPRLPNTPSLQPRRAELSSHPWTINSPSPSNCPVRCSR